MLSKHNAKYLYWLAFCLHICPRWWVDYKYDRVWFTKSVVTDVTLGHDGCQYQPQARHQCPHRSADAAAEAEVITNCLRLLGGLHQLLDQGLRGWDFENSEGKLLQIFVSGGCILFSHLLGLVIGKWGHADSDGETQEPVARHRTVLDSVLHVSTRGDSPITHQYSIWWHWQHWGWMYRY